MFFSRQLRAHRSSFLGSRRDMTQVPPQWDSPREPAPRARSWLIGASAVGLVGGAVRYAPHTSAPESAITAVTTGPAPEIASTLAQSAPALAISVSAGGM